MIIKKEGPYVLINKILAGQTPEALNIFTKFLMEKEFDIIIEIGTGRGGFTEFIYEHCKNCKLITYDITDERNESRNKTIDFRIANSLSEDTVREVESEIKDYNKVLILCDGGIKESEIKIYGRLIKSGDYIMCHDYAYNQESYQMYQQQTLWPSAPESYYYNIKKTIESLNIYKSDYHTDFKKVFWGCFSKV